jgi:hypothetical protein
MVQSLSLLLTTDGGSVIDQEVKLTQKRKINTQDKVRNRKLYRKPILLLLGDLRSLTLGGSPGVFDSGFGNDPEVTKPFP